MESMTERIDAAKKRLDQAEARKNEARGQYKALIQTLKQDFKVDTLKDAKELLAEMDAKIAKKRKDVEAALDKIDEALAQGGRS